MRTDRLGDVNADWCVCACVEFLCLYVFVCDYVHVCGCVWMLDGGIMSGVRTTSETYRSTVPSTRTCRPLCTPGQ